MAIYKDEFIYVKNTKQIYNIHTCEQFFIWFHFYIHLIKRVYLQSTKYEHEDNSSPTLYLLHSVAQSRRISFAHRVYTVQVYILEFTYNMQRNI